MSEKAKNPTSVITEKVRFSYAHVFVPQAIEEGNDPKYSVSIIISKKDKITLGKINKIVDALKEEAVKKYGKLPAKFKTPLRDGDEEKEGDDAYTDSFFVSASSFKKPGIVDANVQRIIEEDAFYSGCYGRASLNFYLFDKAGNKGIGCGLNNLQKLEDGPRLSGGSSAEEDFGEDLM